MQTCDTRAGLSLTPVKSVMSHFWLHETPDLRLTLINYQCDSTLLSYSLHVTFNKKKKRGGGAT